MHFACPKSVPCFSWALCSEEDKAVKKIDKTRLLGRGSRRGLRPALSGPVPAGHSGTRSLYAEQNGHLARSYHKPCRTAVQPIAPVHALRIATVVAITTRR